jgi:hypothetical protein
MSVGENPKKIENIVLNNIARYQEIYLPLFDQHPFKEILTVRREQLQQNSDWKAKLDLISILPASLSIKAKNGNFIAITYQLQNNY